MTDCAPGNLRHRLIIAYGFLINGSRVEFHLHQKTMGEVGSVDWALRHKAQLRPEAILKAMPRGTVCLVEPGCSDLEWKGEGEGRKETRRMSLMWAVENEGAVMGTPRRIKKGGKLLRGVGRGGEEGG